MEQIAHFDVVEVPVARAVDEGTKQKATGHRRAQISGRNVTMSNADSKKDQIPVPKCSWQPFQVNPQPNILEETKFCPENKISPKL